jgi:hypothetical protein
MFYVFRKKVVLLQIHLTIEEVDIVPSKIEDYRSGYITDCSLATCPPHICRYCSNVFFHMVQKTILLDALKTWVAAADGRYKGCAPSRCVNSNIWCAARHSCWRGMPKTTSQLPIVDTSSEKRSWWCGGKQLHSPGHTWHKFHLGSPRVLAWMRVWVRVKSQSHNHKNLHLGFNLWLPKVGLKFICDKKNPNKLAFTSKTP